LWGATKRLAEDARDTAKRQQRAYVFPDGALMRPPTTARGTSWGTTVVIKNFGQTPAYDYSMVTDTRMMPWNPAEVPDLRLPAERRVLGSLAPGGTLTLNLRHRPFTAIEMDALAKGMFRFYVFGEVYYTDAFGAARYTRFCYRWGGDDGSDAGSLANAEHGNESN
jgi:hypothetical protein